MYHTHPLDQLLKDDSLFFLEAMVPFVDYAYKKPLILLIKYQEIRALMQCFDNPSYIAACGFDCHPGSSEEMMNCMCRFLPGDFAGNIKNMQQMLKMMQVMQTMNDSGCDSSFSDCSPGYNAPPPGGQHPGCNAFSPNGQHPEYDAFSPDGQHPEYDAFSPNGQHPGCDAPPPPPDYQPKPDAPRGQKNLYASVLDILNS